MAKRPKRQQPSDPQPISNAKLAADLQAFALAVRLVGLEGLRDGAVTFNGGQPKC